MGEATKMCDTPYRYEERLRAATGYPKADPAGPVRPTGDRTPYLLAGLRRYVHHDHGCPAPAGHCNCGLRDVLNENYGDDDDAERYARAQEATALTGLICPFGDPLCPCPDGDPCHYVDLPGSPAMRPPPPSAEAGDTDG
jgi:hypothetical protein